MYDFDTLYPRDEMASEKWDAAKKVGCPEGVVPLTVADMEFRTAPEIIDAVRQTAEFGLWGYTYGDYTFRKAVTDWMQKRHNWNASPDWIVNTAGIIPAMYTAVQAFTNPGDRIIIQSPVYPPFFGSVRNSGRIVLDNPLQIVDGRYEINFDDLRRKAPLAKMMILCSPHNPVGRVWTRQEVLQIAEICFDNKVLLFSDEIHSDIVFPPYEHTTMGTLPEKYQGNCIIGTAASKTFSLAGLSCASIFIQDSGLRHTFMEQMSSQGEYFNSTFGVVATKAAYEKGEPWLEQTLVYIKQNYLILKDFMAKYFPKTTVYPLEGTYLAWIDFSGLGLNDEEITEFLRKEAALFLNPGKMFGESGTGFARMNLACPRLVLEKALERLYKAGHKNSLME